jgi:hypothetical protein
LPDTGKQGVGGKGFSGGHGRAVEGVGSDEVF